jgi:hypothetical protein
MKSSIFLSLGFLLTTSAISADLTVIEMQNSKDSTIKYHLDGRPISTIQLKEVLSKKLTSAPDAKSTVRIAVLVYPDVKVGFGMPRYFMTTRVNDRLSEIQVNYSPVFPRSGLEAVMSSGQPAADPAATAPAPPR